MADGAEDSVNTPGASGADQPAFLSDRQIRSLKISVIVMSALLLAGFAIVIGRIVYLLNRSPVEAASPAVIAMPAGPPVDVALPHGAAVRNIALSGNHLAVHFEAPDGPGVVVIDMKSGQAIRRISMRTQGGK